MKLQRKDDPVFWDWYKEYTKKNALNSDFLKRSDIKEVMFTSWKQSRIVHYNDDLAYIVKETHSRAKEWAIESYKLCIDELHKANILKKGYKDSDAFKNLYKKLIGNEFQENIIK